MTEKTAWTVETGSIEHDTKHVQAIIADMLSEDCVDSVRVEIKPEAIDS